MKLTTQHIRTNPIFRGGHKTPASVLEYPADGVELARNNRPVVLLHGTLVTKDGIEAYRDFALKSGHPVNHRDYPSITQGEAIEKSTEIASVEVNRSRAEVARHNLARLQGADEAEVHEFFQLDGELYGSQDADLGAVGKAIPGLLAATETLLRQSPREIDSKFSRQIRAIQTQLGESLESAGLGPEKAGRVASELVDTIAPKVVLIGHSAGGFVAHTMTVNPETSQGEDDFSYDGGLGVGELILLSSPIGQGLPSPAPPGVLELPFYNFDSKVLRPLEDLPMVKLARLNPLTDFIYNSNKSILKTASAFSSFVSFGLTSPLVHLARPGYEQVEEGSEFFQKYVKNKEVPEGVTAIAMTSPLDRLSLEERSRLGTGQENTHNLSVDLGLSEEKLKKERPTFAHVVMSENPQGFKEQFAHHLRDDSSALLKMLGRKNDESVRHEALRMLRSEMALQPSLLADKAEIRAALEEVAGERLPFRDSASYLAYQLLKLHESKTV